MFREEGAIGAGSALVAPPYYGSILIAIFCAVSAPVSIFHFERASSIAARVSSNVGRKNS
jgi:hypothetical protein